MYILFFREKLSSKIIYMYILSIILILVILFFITKNKVVENLINLGYVCINRPKKEIKKHNNNPNLRFDRGGII